jgi:hypothetical protein
MKIGKKKKFTSPLVRRLSGEDQDDGAVGKKYGWMQTSEEAQSRALKESTQRSMRNRPPEVWLKDGEEKTLRFRGAGALATFARYRLQLDGKWRAFTKPADGDTDLFQSELGLNDSFCALFEVVDISGYRDKDGKRHRYIPRFYVVGARQYEQLRLIQRKRGGRLDKFDIVVSRSGSGTQTSYAFIPEMDSPSDPKVKAAASLKEDVNKYYAPPTESEQRAIVNKLRRRSGHSDESDGEDDDN